MAALNGKRIAVVGYGNQGRSQALNLRDSGCDVIIGNIDDEYKERAVKDGFETLPIAEAAGLADIVMILLPDEVAPDVFDKEIGPGLSEGNLISFASGYNVFYGFIVAPPNVDVGLVGPRMGGGDVRKRYLSGEGFPSLISVEQDASGRAEETIVALAMGIGSTMGAFMSSCREETLVDLFGEQLQGMSLYTTQLAFDLLVDAGCSPESVLLELYMSEEVSDDWKNMARRGLWKQLTGHSRTSQYGQLTRGESQLSAENKRFFEQVLDDIRTGRFARELATERMTGYPVFRRLMERALSHRINGSEDMLRGLLKQRNC